MPFNWSILSDRDYKTARQILGHNFRDPDLTIAPDATPYLYRWHVIPRNEEANVYMHVQVQSDPERPLHDHPWANTSVILSGGYKELIQPMPPTGRIWDVDRFAGQVIHRTATEAHRLILPAGLPYTMTLFTTGPKVRDWGFWCKHHDIFCRWRGDMEWLSHKDTTVFGPDGSSIYTGPKE